MSIHSEAFGSLADGTVVDRFTLEHQGLMCRIITLGGIVTELHVPDASGNTVDIVLGLPSLQAYEAGHPYFGAITGRVAGRINAGRFELDGTTYQLPLSQPPNHLHGGVIGLDKRVWSAEASESSTGEPILKLQYTSPAGEEDYPGTVPITVTYTLTDDASLRIDYEATTDAPTPLSITNHSYFNLAGEGNGTIGEHVLQILAEKVVMGDEDGTLEDHTTEIEGTIHDFRTPKALSEFIAPPTHYHGENYLFADGKQTTPRLGAVLTHPASGRKMEVLTTETSVQLYTGKFLEDTVQIGKAGNTYINHGGVCLECQGFPNGVNNPEIDDIFLRPGETYLHTTLYRFSTDG